MKTPLALVSLGVAFWPVWRWYALRMADGSDEKWGLLSLATVLLLAWVQKKDGRDRRPPLVLLGAVVVAYIAAYPFVPPLIRAAVAVTALGIVLGRSRFGSAFHPASWGLLLLSLPVAASMQYYLGYPLRVLAAKATALLVSLAGFPVSAQGTGLLWEGETVLVDAPCSGVRMLWAGMWLAFTLAGFFGLGAARTVVVGALALVAVVAGNALRATILFFGESGIFRWPDWVHPAVGLACFAAVAGFLFWITKRLDEEAPCRPARFS